MSETRVAVIGGTGLYELDGLSNLEKLSVTTPFGEPSSKITRARLEGVTLFFLARHGEGHRFLPSEINYRANIYALKSLGAQWCLSVSAVGSLQERLVPGHVVVPEQLIDRTKNRESTFFGNGAVAHVAFGSPYCSVLREELYSVASEVADKRNSVAHYGGSLVCIEGPAFSTRAESHLYRDWEASVIGMTALPEAKLAREAEMAYATLCLVTDYDCWRTDDAEVDVEELLKTLAENASLGKQIISELAPRLAALAPSPEAADALKNGLVTPVDKIPVETREKLAAIIGRYLESQL